MGNIWLVTELWYNDEDYAWGPSYENYGAFSAQANAFTSCLPEEYSGRMEWYIEWPGDVESLGPTEGVLETPAFPISCQGEQ
jgi:hypothetical protein